MSEHHAKLNPRLWAAVRRKVLARDKWRCTQCGRPGRLEVHHHARLENDGDAYDLSNLSSMCRSCHIRLHRADHMTEGRRDWWKFVEELAKAPQKV